MIGIIGGSGLARLVGLANVRRRIERTPWGDPSSALSIGELHDVPVVFLARHGYGHTIAPHDINARANIWALKQAGATRIVAVATVGGIRADLVPGELLVPDQLIDYTSGRAGTYYSGPDQPVVHVDFTHPYDAGVRRQLLAAGAALGERIHDGGCYGCTNGPRFETAAEIRRMERDGCDVVGMSGMPEAVLAREAELPYATLAVVSNAAPGKAGAADGVSLTAISDVLDQAMDRVLAVLGEVVRQPA